MRRRKAVERADRIQGARWEQELFGVPVSDGKYTRDMFPPYMDFNSSVREVIVLSCQADSEGQYIYNPKKPKPGISRELWREVLRNLPHTTGTKYGAPKERLYLYLAVGKTSLDVWHGVDAFFLWHGVVVTLDASTVHKTKEATGYRHLKADFVLTRDNTSSAHAIACLGLQIAALLMKRVLDPEPDRRFRSGLPIRWIRR